MAKVHYEIIKRTQRSDVIGVDMGNNTGKHQVKFRKGGSTARITDPALAKDIAQSIGQESGRRDCDVLVAEVPNRDPDRIVSTGFGPGKWDEIRKEQNKKRNNK